MANLPRHHLAGHCTDAAAVVLIPPDRRLQDRRPAERSTNGGPGYRHGEHDAACVHRVARAQPGGSSAVAYTCSSIATMSAVSFLQLRAAAGTRQR
jgi:hypothetical protein